MKTNWRRIVFSWQPSPAPKRKFGFALGRDTFCHLVTDTFGTLVSIPLGELHVPHRHHHAIVSPIVNILKWAAATVDSKVFACTDRNAKALRRCLLSWQVLGRYTVSCSAVLYHVGNLECLARLDWC